MFFKNSKGRNVIRVTDTTDHGGEVLTGSGIMSVEHKPVARVGDMVRCPQCNGTFPIVEGDEMISAEGRRVAFDGHLTACRARLISSLGSSISAMQNTVYYTAPETASATNVQHSYTGSSTSSPDISDIKIHNSPIFRYRESTDEILLVMINNNNMGHAGFMIGEGKDAMLYDPAGSYTGCYLRACENGDPSYRGSDDAFKYAHFDWNDYLAYQRADGPKVNVYQFIVSEEQSQIIRIKLQRRGGANPPYCATAIAEVLKSSGGEFSNLSEPMLIRTPWGLEDELKSIMFPGQGGFISPAY